MKILITGGSGFIGRSLTASLSGEHEVFAPGRAELDLLDAEGVRAYLDIHHFDAIIHGATERSNRRIGSPNSLLNNNCRMFFNLARNSHTFGRMLFLSSGAVYDRAHWQPRMPEDYFDKHVPADDYGFSKYICAKAIDAMERVHELRLFAVFGPYEDWRVRFISNACCRAAWGLPIVIRQNVRFDYLPVSDLAVLVSGFLSRPPKSRQYNVCAGTTYELAEIALMVRQASGRHMQIIVKTPGLGTEYSGDNRRLLSEVPDFHPTDVECSIERLYQWYHARKHEIDPAALRFDE